MKKQDYKQQVKTLRADLIQMQLALKEADFPVLIVVGGDDRSGRHETLNLLHEWMDPRYLQANAYGLPTDEEQQKPFMWRYWKDLPPQGVVGLCLRDWLSYSVIERLVDTIDQDTLQKRINYSNSFEKTLTSEGMLIIKIWLHLPEDELKQRLKVKQQRYHRVWQIHQQDHKIYGNFDQAKLIIRNALKDTNHPACPWNFIDSSDIFDRNISVGQLILESVNQRIESNTSTPVSPINEIPSFESDHLSEVDLSAALDKATYKKELKKWQKKASQLLHLSQENDKSCVIVFEGWDAAGKGGCIRRLTNSMDAGFYRVVPIAAPTEEERAHHYLWRFWRKVPRAGRITIFDRSWYGRVLVERVEGFATSKAWHDAYAEINDFEQQLHDRNIPVIKFWMHIDKDEQLRRFEEREVTPHKHHKITEEDYRNREKWDEYETAINDMIDFTSTEHAPWRIIASNNKLHARIEVLKQVCQVLEQNLGLKQ